MRLSFGRRSAEAGPAIRPRGRGLGTFAGVFTPSILTILGVIMYLRLGWVIGSVGLLPTLFIITLSTSITFLTALSVSAIATDQHVRTGGAYYMISRSVGVETGGAVGIPLYLAQALSVGDYLAPANLHAPVRSYDSYGAAAITQLGRDSAAVEASLHCDREVDPEGAVHRSRLEDGRVIVRDANGDAAIGRLYIETSTVPLGRHGVCRCFPQKPEHRTQRAG